MRGASPQHDPPDLSPALEKSATATEAEAALWRILRDPRLATLKFRRQAPIQPDIADFVCFAHRLIFEVDGSQQAESIRDVRRDAFLESQSYVVLRFWNADILTRPRMIEDTILARCGLLG